MLVARQMCPIIPPQADDSRHHLGRRRKNSGRNLEEIFDVEISLEQHAENAIHLAAVGGGDALGHFLLKHAHYLVDPLPVAEHSEEDLRRDVVRKIADDREAAWEKFGQVRLEEISFEWLSLR